MDVQKQKDVFLASEGDQWFLRNQSKLTAENRDDVLVSELEKLANPPRDILEVGCSNGWRLECLRKRWGSAVYGIDPSSRAIDAARLQYPAVNFRVGTADELPYGDSQFDLVILGFCLYLCDRED